MGTKLERIAEISAETKKPVFTSIYHLINAELLKQCHKELDGKKAVGVDKVTKEEYGKNLDRNIEDLVQRLKNKSFKPLPSLRVYIPKGNGKMRPLGIASYEDKIVQMAVALKQLSERNRETLLMYYFLEMNNEEIAKKQNISRSGVFQNRHNSLALMKKLLKEKQ